ncbi:MAG: NTP transferase domain-containing protein [Desulfobulbaceae bacterium]|nr:NTP transferase domain-containing protein [Desulfobulbaceae bacterium]
MEKSVFCSIVLAAGKGTRMNSAKPKVLHEVFFAPMVHHVLDALQPLMLERTIVVTGHCHAQVESQLKAYTDNFVFQEQQLGTGHAVLSCLSKLNNFNGTVLIICGDTPLIRTETLRALLEDHQQSDALLTVMSTFVDEPLGYGRIITDQTGDLVRIVEEKDALLEQKKIKEINAGIYCVDGEFLFDALKEVGTDNQQGEMYLTDIVAIARGKGFKVNKYVCADREEVIGVNSRQELALAHGCLQRRFLNELMAAGVTILQPETVTIEKSVCIGPDSVVSPNTYISGNTVIGRNVVIEPFVKIADSKISDGVRVRSFSFIENRDVSS